MQPYSYAAYPYPNGAPRPVRYMAPPNYRPSSTVHPIQYAPQPMRYPPRYYARGLPPPPRPMTTMMPMVPPQSQQFQHPQAYYYSHNGINPAVSYNSKIPTIVPKTATKVKVPKSYQITRRKVDFQDNESSDDEYEQVPLDSPRPQTFKQSSVQTRRPTAYIQRVPSVVSNCSHCSTCTNCSCSECLNENGRRIYPDCPQCRVEWEYQQAQATRQKYK